MDILSQPAPSVNKNDNFTKSDELATVFRDRFFCRTDAYALFLPTSTAPFKVDKPVTLDVIRSHLTGVLRIGAYSTALGDSCLWGCLDIDHTGHTKKLSYEEALRLYDLGLAMIAKARELGMSAYLERSKRGGWHVWLFAQSPISAALMRRVLRALLGACDFPMRADASKTGPKDAIELFPMQDAIGSGYGNPVFLPYCGGDPLGMTVFVEPDHPELKAFPVVDFLAHVQPVPVARLAEVGEMARAQQSNHNGHATAHEPPPADEDASLILARLSSKCQRFKDALAVQENGGLEEPDWFQWIHTLTTAGYAETAHTFSQLSHKHDKRSESRLSTCERDKDSGKAKPPIRCTTFGCDEEQITACFAGVVFRKEDGISNNPMVHVREEYSETPAEPNGGAPPDVDWGDEATFDIPPPDQFPCTDLGNGERFVAKYGADLRFCNQWGKWLTWDGARWELDNRQRVRKWARLTVRSMYEETRRLTKQVEKAKDEKEKEKIATRATALLKHAVRSEAEPRLNAAISLAQIDCPVLPDELDTNPWLLNVLNGTLDLRTGRLQTHRREDLLTKMIPIEYDPDARCPLWEEFLESVMDGKQDLIDFLQKAIGYSLTGNTKEDCLFLLYGTGRNGKTTFQKILRSVTGDYGRQAAFSTFLHRDSDTVRNDLADLRGARLVTAGETDQDKRLSEAVVKQLTGRDTMKARFLFQEHFEFEPQLKIWLAANYKPIIRGRDVAIWARIRLVPFTQKFEGKNDNKKLGEALREELPGILAWAVHGCLEWQKEGLPMPDAVKAATDEYRKEMDTVGNFLEECCVLSPHVRFKATALYTAYVKWSGDKLTTQTAFGKELNDRGLESKKERDAVYRLGVSLLEPVDS